MLPSSGICTSDTMAWVAALSTGLHASYGLGVWAVWPVALSAQIAPNHVSA